jgi:cytochrome c oxidase cbb3-type subunit 1
MWISGITQGLMWRAFDEFGNLQYSFAESVAAMMPFYAMRAIGGMFFLSGTVRMTYNMFMTIRQGKRENAALEARLAAKMAHA